MENLAFALLNVTTAETYEETISKALTILVDFVQPNAAILMVWDGDLSRYIVGDTWMKIGDESAFRRKDIALSRAARCDQHCTPEDREWFDICSPQCWRSSCWSVYL